MSRKEMILKLLTVIVGTVIAAFGLDIAIYAGFGSALYSLADFGKGPYEALTFAFVHKNQWPIQNVRIILDVMCVLLGWILGCTVGICTIATIMLSGALLQKFVKILKPAIDTIVLGKAIH